MMSLAAIQNLSREVAAKAASEGKVPFLVDKQDLSAWRAIMAQGIRPMLPFPALGDYIPEGWELVEERFVDKTGMGDPGEPAMTVKQLLAWLQPGLGYALREEGPFQVFVGAFRKEGSGDDA